MLTFFPKCMEVLFASYASHNETHGTSYNCGNTGGLAYVLDYHIFFPHPSSFQFQASYSMNKIARFS